MGHTTRKVFLAAWCLIAVALGACSEVEDAPPPVFIVITATPASTSTPVVIVVTATPEPPTPTLVPGFAGRLRGTDEDFSESTPTPVIATATPTPTPEATRTPFPTLTPTGVPLTRASLETPTSVPVELPTMVPTAFVCGYAEVVLIGAGKAHKPCQTPTPTGVPIFYDTATPFPTRTATAISIPTAIRTPTPIPTSVFLAVASSEPQPIATATGTTVHIVTPSAPNSPTATRTPVPEGAGHPASRHLAEKQYMLELINIEREKAGVPLVELGSNVAAQLHAEASIENCISSHWGIDGLKPYMRYSLAGGYQPNGENWSGIDYCIKASDGYSAIQSINRKIDRSMEGLMNSPGHRRNILNKYHRKVNVGLAWDSYNFNLAQHFEGDYVEFDSLPKIENGVLSFRGNGKNGVRFAEDRDLGVIILYDPPPHGLTRGQVSRTYCYDNGRQVASLRWPLTDGRRWTQDEYTGTYNKRCPDPYDVPPDAPPPNSLNEAHEFWEEAYKKSQDRDEQTITVPWVSASEWTADDQSFSVTADISEILDEYGSGVYTIMIWGNLRGERAVISQHSIFHGVTLPDTYTRH